jgi:hypothetical protein
MDDTVARGINQEPLAGEFTVSGYGRQGALAAGLAAVLQRVVPQAHMLAETGESRASAIRGEGADLAALFADLVTDLLEQLEEAGGEALSVRLDGLLRKDQGGFVAWGYVDLPASPGPAATLPRLIGHPEITETDGSLVSIRAALRVE